MDVAAEIHKIINATIIFSQNNQDLTKIAELLHLTKNFLFVLDTNKEVPYRIAIICEYLEGIGELLPSLDVQTVINYLNDPTNKAQQQDICADVNKVLIKYFDPDKINPNLVIFWLGRSCNWQEIKIMSTLMLFLEPAQQKSVLDFDKNFLVDPKLQFLKNCLPKE